MNSISGSGFSHYSPMSYHSPAKSERQIVNGINMPVNVPHPIRVYAVQLRNGLVDSKPNAKVHVHVDHKAGQWEITANSYANGKRSTETLDMDIAAKLANSAEFENSGYKLSARLQEGIIVIAKKVIC